MMGCSPVPPLISELVPAESVPGGQGRDVDSLLGESPVDVEAELLALISLEGAFVVGFVHRVQSQKRRA